MATTTNYGWTTPDDTALVKDGAAAIRTLGSSVDTTTKNLNPETTLGDIAYRSSTPNVNTRLGIGSTGQVLTVASGVPSWAAAAGATYAIFRDLKATGNAGGTFTSGAWRTRDINNTQFNGITGASIASNQITLAAGSYFIDTNATAYNVTANQLRLQNITDTTTTIIGICDYAASNSNASLMGYFTITGTKVFEIQHRAQTTAATIGFGVEPNPGFGTDVIYVMVSLAKVA